ncbi:MAG: helix-hairpin-helix domain-containing protein [Balneolaceae bacterium]|nr:helix-hairpin-helix domain-containing protein [Balneolaceae bacterium]
MLRRRLFFLFEKLKITPAERRTMAVLLAALLLLSAARLMVNPASPYDEDFYRETDARFDSLSRAFSPASPLPGTEPAAFPSADTVEGDTLRHPADSTSLLTSPEVPRININSADALALQALPGIGPVYAARIVAWREQFGLFQDVDELLHIRGIGEIRLEKIKPFIKLTVDSTQQAH